RARVKREMAASCVIEIADDFLISSGNIGNQFFICWIKFSGRFQIFRYDHLKEELSRSRNGLLCHSIFIFQSFYKFKMIYKWVVSGGDFSNQVSIVNQGRFPMERDSLFCLMMFHTIESPHKIKMPCGSAEFSVCDHMISGFFLFVYQVCNTLIFCFMKFFF